MKIKIIKNESEYELFLERISDLMTQKKLTQNQQDAVAQYMNEKLGTKKGVKLAQVS